MKDGTQVILIGMSKWEPQFTQGVLSCSNQSVPFDKITIIDSYVPLYAAFKKAIKELEYNKLFFTSGDIILNPDDHKNLLSIYNKEQFKKIYCYKYPIYDWFLQRNIHAMRLLNSEVWLDIGIDDVLREDVITKKKAEQKGFIEIDFFGRRKRPKIVIGCHFKEPNSFQVFRRFYIRGIKDQSKKNGKTRLKNDLQKLFVQTQNKKYRLAIDAFNFGFKIDNYNNRSHNIELDLEIYKKFKND